MTINEIQDSIIYEFSNIGDWFEKYQYLINLGKNSCDNKIRESQYLLPGCQTQVWIKAYLVNDKIYFNTDSDSAIINGVLSLLLRIFNNQYPADILKSEIYFIEKIGLQSTFSPSRANGVSTIIRYMRHLCESFFTSHQ